MNVLGTIQEKLGHYILERNINRASRSVEVCNFDTAQTAGVVFNATHLINFEMVKKFVDFLQYKEIKVHTMGFVNSKKLIDHYLFRKGYDFFTKKHLNWYMRPTRNTVDDFIAQPFDILFNLSLESYYPIQYIVGMSKAKFKVGVFSQEDKFLDFMIDISRERKIRNGVLNEVRKERNNNTRMVEEDVEMEVAKKVQQEIDIDFLINEIMYYVSLLNNPRLN